MIPADRLESVLVEAAKQALDGTLSDATRVRLYRLALTVAAEEFYRIESTQGGSVAPGVLMIIQQIAALCEDKVDAERLMSAEAAARLSEPAIEVVTK